MDTVKVSGKKIIMERYINKNGEAWVRLKFIDKNRTEIILPESEFEKQYGRFD